MKENNTLKIVIVVALIAVLAGVFMLIGSNRKVSDVFTGSTSEGQGYSATTTGSQGQGVTGVAVLKTSAGMLGSYVITGANTGLVNFYDATTTNSSLRDSSQSTSTILIASFPASVAAGTYTFDVATSRGLVMVVTGTAATGTVTSR